jgi:hypothetical protein
MSTPTASCLAGREEVPTSMLRKRLRAAVGLSRLISTMRTSHCRVRLPSTNRNHALTVVLSMALLVTACQNKTRVHAVEAPIFAAQVSANGKSVVLSANADRCAHVSSTSVREDKAQVVVQVFIRGSEGDCASLVAGLLQTTVHLKQRLGSRTLTRRDGSVIRLAPPGSPLFGIPSGVASPTR